MDAKAEQKSLMANPLPPELNIAVVDYVTNCPADRVLTNITLIDAETERIQKELKPFLTSLMTQREQLLARAKKEGIKEDAEAVLIEIKGKQMRNEITDLDAFELQFPGKLAEIRKEQTLKLAKDLLKKLQNLDESDVPLGMADDVVGKEKVTEFVGHQPTQITYDIRRK